MLDERTRSYYEDLCSRSNKPTVYFPQMMADHYVNHGIKPLTDEIKRKIFRYDGLYSEWYRCLAYMVYGYGNLSNNDRRRNGLPAVRKRRK